MNNNGLDAWEANAEFWDKAMGDESNDFHRNLVRPNVEPLLCVEPNDFVLDVACGNGNFSKRLAELGARVVAFDYSSRMIELAKSRRADVFDKVEFHVCDATDFDALMGLRREKLFDKAVANMAIMDISDIEPLFRALGAMLKPNGVFVCATHHPCFTFTNGDYFDICTHKGVAINGQPMLQNYYHRTMEDIFGTAFNAGFAVDGLREIPMEGDKTPNIIVVRFRRYAED